MEEKEGVTDIDNKVQTLRKNQDAWTITPIKTKLILLKETLNRLLKAKSQYCKLVTEGKRSQLQNEEWAQFAVPTLRLMRQLIEALESANWKDGKYDFSSTVKLKNVNKRIVIPAFPVTTWDGLAYPGVTGEIWIQPGKELQQGNEFNAKIQSKKGALCLVLGAGNQQSIPILDALYKLINCKEVVFLKHNPVNEWFYPVVEEVMKSFIDFGVFAHAKGDAEIGKYLTSLCDNIHITGSDRTYDAIVWGNLDKTDPEQKPQFQEITSELGCITPNIIVPGKYTTSQLKYLVDGLAGATGANCSFNCVAPKLIVTQKNWPQRAEFFQLLKEYLSIVKPIYPYYPGAETRHKSFRETYPKSEVIGDAPEGYLPFLWVPDVPPEPEQKAFTCEAWSPVLCETGIDCSEEEFLEKSVDFVNNHVWGNLSCSLFILPSSEKKYSEAFNRALDNLRYGSIGVNIWTAIAYSMGTPWGAYPGNDSRNIQSGIGYVHNPFMIENVEKTVFRAPFQLLMNTKLPWFASSKQGEQFWKKVTEFEEDSGASSVTSLVWGALWN